MQIIFMIFQVFIEIHCTKTQQLMPRKGWIILIKKSHWAGQCAKKQQH